MPHLPSIRFPLTAVFAGHLRKITPADRTPAVLVVEDDEVAYTHRAALHFPDPRDSGPAARLKTSNVPEIPSLQRA